MRLRIVHQTHYTYDQPVPYGLQRLRLVPRDGDTQRVLDWAVTIDGATEEVRFLDQFGNDTRLLGIAPGPQHLTVLAQGTVETRDGAGVAGPHRGFAPLWLYLASTPLTLPGDGIAALVKPLAGTKKLELLHDLMALVSERIAYVPGTTATTTTAEEALKLGSGVCQDHAHAFVAAARTLGIPSRYVSGYLLMEDQTDQVASHAWAESHVDGLGWVGFDAANSICPDERYVRLAVGRDYRDATPVSGIIMGQASERLEVRITVEQ